MILLIDVFIGANPNLSQWGFFSIPSTPHSFSLHVVFQEWLLISHIKYATITQKKLISVKSEYLNICIHSMCACMHKTLR